MSGRNEQIRFNAADPIPIASHLSQAIQRGLPLESGLRALAEETRSRRTKDALQNLANELEQGTSFDNAIKNHADGLPRRMQAIVRAGIESGRLDVVMRHLIEQLQRATSLRNLLWLSLSYPIFIVCFSTLICTAIVLWIVPQFKSIFDGFGVELPQMTVAILFIADALHGYYGIPKTLLIVSCITVFPAAFVVGLSRWGQRRLTSIPLIGQVFRLAALADFCQMLAALIESGMPFPKALQIAGDACDDFWMEERCSLFVREMNEGSTPSSAAGVAGFPNTLCQVFRNIHAQDAFSEALLSLSEFYKAQCNDALSIVASVLGQLSIAFVAAFTITTTFCLFMPLIVILNSLL